MMREFAGYLLIGCLAAMATGAVTLAGLGYAVGARPAVGSGAIIQHVDRANKGDRLNLPSVRPEPEPVMVGCDPAFSPLSVSTARANFAARCVAGLTIAPVAAG